MDPALKDLVIAYRGKHNMTQADFGRLLGGLTGASVSLIEQGGKPGKDKIVQLAEILGLSPEQFRQLSAWVLGVDSDRFGKALGLPKATEAA